MLFKKRLFSVNKNLKLVFTLLWHFLKETKDISVSGPPTYLSSQWTCACPFVQYFCTFFHPKLSWYHPIIMYENIIQKDMNKFNGFYIFYNVQEPKIWVGNCPPRFELLFRLGRTKGKGNQIIVEDFQFPVSPPIIYLLPTPLWLS